MRFTCLFAISDVHGVLIVSFLIGTARHLRDRCGGRLAERIMAGQRLWEGHQIRVDSLSKYHQGCKMGSEWVRTSSYDQGKTGGVQCDGIPVLERRGACETPRHELCEALQSAQGVADVTRSRAATMRSRKGDG